MQEYLNARDVQKGHFIHNPLPVNGDGPWIKVIDVQRNDDIVTIKTNQFSLRKNHREGVTVLFDLERQ